MKTGSARGAFNDQSVVSAKDALSLVAGDCAVFALKVAEMVSLGIHLVKTYVHTGKHGAIMFSTGDEKDELVVVDSTARGVITLKDGQSFSLVFEEGSDAKTLEFKRSGTVLSSSRSGTFKEIISQADTFLLRPAQHQWRSSSIIILFRQWPLAGACGGFNGMVLSMLTFPRAARTWNYSFSSLENAPMVVYIQRDGLNRIVDSESDRPSTTKRYKHLRGEVVDEEVQNDRSLTHRDSLDDNRDG